MCEVNNALHVHRASNGRLDNCNAAFRRIMCGPKKTLSEDQSPRRDFEERSFFFFIFLNVIPGKVMFPMSLHACQRAEGSNNKVICLLLCNIRTRVAHGRKFMVSFRKLSMVRPRIISEKATVFSYQSPCGMTSSQSP